MEIARTNVTEHADRLLVLAVRLGRRGVHGEIVEEHDHQEQHHAQNVREHGQLNVGEHLDGLRMFATK